MFKKVISIIVSAAIGCSMLAVTASADHKVPDGNGAVCTNTNYTYEHNGDYFGVQTVGTIQHNPNGSTCVIYMGIFGHDVSCFCDADLGTANFGCQISHSNCASYMSTCGN